MGYSRARARSGLIQGFATVSICRNKEWRQIPQLLRKYFRSKGYLSICTRSSADVVFHLAAQPLVLRSYKDPLETWATNVQGSLNLLQALKPLAHTCAVVMVTTDKVYANREWDFGYRENDNLGGHDPYSASKAAAEIAIASWRSSFCGSAPHQTPYLAIATARAGNVIVGATGQNRIMPDAMRALAVEDCIRFVDQPPCPWQHVLELERIPCVSRDTDIDWKSC